MSCATSDRVLPSFLRQRRWAIRLADIAGATCRAVWADSLSGFAAYGAAQAGCRLDQGPTQWTEAHLDTLLLVPVPATSASQRKPMP